jgi:hypothetical protein
VEGGGLVSTVLISYKPDARVSEAVSGLDSRRGSWDLGVNYEDTVYAKTSEAVSGFNPMLRSWGLGVNYEDTFRNVSDSVG